MNELKIFENSEFGRIRVIEEDGRVLFCGPDAANALGYSNSRDALSRHCKGVVKRDTLTGGGVQALSFIPEGDLYRLITHSKLPTAERFESWVFDEVLPTIRKHGAYIPDELLDAPEALRQLCEALLEERRKNAQLSQKAVYFDRFVASGYSTNLRTTAKELGIPEKKFVQFLLDQHFLYRSPSGTLLPYSKQEYKPLFVVRDFCRNGYAGAYTLVTPEGKRYFATLRDGILAL